MMALRMRGALHGGLQKMRSIKMVDQNTGEIIEHDNGVNLTLAADVDPVSWHPQAELDYDEWYETGKVLQQMHKSLAWWIGDWLNYGDFRWGEAFTQAIEMTGLSVDVLRNYKWVANKVDRAQRDEQVSWSHYRIIAPMVEQEQEQWVRRVKRDNLSVADLRKAIELERIDQLPPQVVIEEEEDVEVDDVERLRYALEQLLLRHLAVCDWDTDSDAVVRAQHVLDQVNSGGVAGEFEVYDE
jgi:hypothetical protein